MAMHGIGSARRIFHRKHQDFLAGDVRQLLREKRGHLRRGLCVDARTAREDQQRSAVFQSFHAGSSRFGRGRLRFLPRRSKRAHRGPRTFARRSARRFLNPSRPMFRRTAQRTITNRYGSATDLRSTSHSRPSSRLSMRLGTCALCRARLPRSHRQSRIRQEPAGMKIGLNAGCTSESRNASQRITSARPRSEPSPSSCASGCRSAR